MEADSILITCAKSADLPGILALFADTINTVCTKDYSAEQHAAWTASAKDTKRWTKKLKTQYFLVARLRETIVGFASLKDNTHVDLLFVHKDFQGRGIAKSLYKKMQQQAINKQVRVITSDVSFTARSFFEKMGFMLIARQDNLVRGVNLPNLKMKKILT